MQAAERAITPKGTPHDAELAQAIIALYEAEPDLTTLPAALFAGIGRLIDADVVTYSEFHHTSGEFRSLLSVEDDPARRAEGIAAYARHMHSHAFWSYDPTFFGERALRESDFFGDEEFLAPPIAREVFPPSNARHIMSIVMQHEAYVLTINGFRTIGRPAFGDAARDRLEAFRPHIVRSYRQALPAHPRHADAHRPAAHRLPRAHPAPARGRLVDRPRQVERGHRHHPRRRRRHGEGARQGDPRQVGADGRLAIAVIAHTIPPFARMPPLWRIGEDVWAGAAQRERDRPRRAS